MNIRILTTADVPSVRVLWQERFSESDRFLDWYLSERFVPELSCGIFTDAGELICQAHGRPLPLKVGPAEINSLMIGGVSTNPKNEKQGHMHSVLSFLENLASDSGFDALFLAAYHPEIYHSAGFIDCGGCVSGISQGDAYGSLVPFKQASNAVIGQLFSVYGKVAYKYDYAPVRDIAAMQRFVADCFAKKCLLLVTSDNNQLTGYAFYDPDYGETEEVFATDEKSYLALVSALPPGTKYVLPTDRTAFGPMRVLSLIKPLTPRTVKLCAETFALGYCAETY